MVYYSTSSFFDATRHRAIRAREHRRRLLHGSWIDTGCKVLAIDGDLLFVSTGMTRGPDWDNNSIIRDIYDRHKSKSDTTHTVELADVAKEWSQAVSGHFNDLIKRNILNLMTIGLRRDEAVTLAYLGGIDEGGKLVLYRMSIIPDVLLTSTTPNAVQTGCSAHNNFCAIGDDVWIVVEFADGTSERAKKEVVDWKPPNTANKLNFDSYRTKRMAELVVQHQSGNSIGGRIDFVQLRRNGKLHWFDRKDNCPEK